jgi:CheY-like chemotaxis protein
MARILFIEERPETCYFMSLIMRAEGHTVDPYSNLDHALDACKKGKYDILLIDLDSSFDGFEFYRQISLTDRAIRPCLITKQRSSAVNKLRKHFPHLSESCLADRPVTAMQLTSLLVSASQTGADKRSDNLQV